MGYHLQSDLENDSSTSTNCNMFLFHHKSEELISLNISEKKKILKFLGFKHYKEKKILIKFLGFKPPTSIEMNFYLQLNKILSH